MVNVRPNSRVIVVVAGAAVVIAATAVVVDGFAIPTTYTRNTCSSSTELFLGASSALPSSSFSPSSIYRVLDTLPDINELSTAPFMQQVQYGMAMTEALHVVASCDIYESPTIYGEHIEEHQYQARDMELQKLLQAQLSHSDGIRGFMVAYLTSDSSASASENEDEDEDSWDSSYRVAERWKQPRLLIDALQGLLLAPTTKHNNNNEHEDEEMAEQQQQEQLVSLMLMNVIMPTAMMTMHENEEAAASSKVTSLRGQRLLQSVVEFTPRFPQHIQAIQHAAGIPTTNPANLEIRPIDHSTLVNFWQDFYLKWGYKEQQKKDIVRVMRGIYYTTAYLSK